MKLQLEVSLLSLMIRPLCAADVYPPHGHLVKSAEAFRRSGRQRHPGVQTDDQLPEATAIIPRWTSDSESRVKQSGPKSSEGEEAQGEEHTLAGAGTGGHW
ncbi:Fc receptor-like protein [Sarotherodon galilaeus]